MDEFGADMPFVPFFKVSWRPDSHIAWYVRGMHANMPELWRTSVVSLKEIEL